MIFDGTLEEISEFKGEFAFLSNFHPSPIRVGDWIFPTVENAYQALKLEDGIPKKKFTWITPGQAKREGRRGNMKPNWDQEKDEIMFKLVYAKFAYHEELKEQLLATGLRPLLEGNNWHDNYWGACLCPSCEGGLNRLGNILMKVREMLRDA